ncbi:protein POLAR LOCALIZATION DURING ASYMMETRIC DIVISION AND REDISTRIBUTION-like [Ananas comosus]|uniref:Protein POLAR LOCALIZATION DURING ASYMMETRIC DIVISION AND REDISTRIBUTION-like n=1 Tax=Ananas comosus TaxID=4615 RepID=A0A6P5F8Y1_ANACO|nr:protein POLAR LOCALIZATION DURING ASYMMETRIC DIVISION AND REDISTRIBUTION-like [Ananas comosus]
MDVDDDAIMESERRRRRGSELVLASPSPSSKYSPRSLLSRLLLLLPLRRASPSSAAAGIGGGGGGGSEGFGCRVRIPGYCSGGKETREKGNGEGDGGDDDDEEEEEGEGGVEVRVPCDRDRAAEIEGGGVGSGESRSKEISISSGHKPEDVCLTLGIGVSLVFLLTKSATELNKITELRRQIEMLLVDIKNQMRKKNVSFSIEESNNAPMTGSSSFGNINRGDSVDYQENGSSRCLESVHCAFNPSTNPNCGSIRVNQSSIGMDQIEAELEVELELLQFSLNAKNSVQLPPHGESEPENGKSNLSESLSWSCGDDSEVKEQKAEEKESIPNCGVSAHELERRLHELLETRQQERIRELESALACAENNLREKEREIYWWRDTARLVSQHKDEALLR